MSIKARTQEIQLELNLQLDGSEIVYSNAIGLKLILSNLLSNAIKYSCEHSKIVFSVTSNHDRVVIKIKDYGVGMDEYQLQKLFQKYGNLNQEKAGQGIGLYMVKKLVDYFDGHISIRSKMNEGTEVCVEFPLHDERHL